MIKITVEELDIIVQASVEQALTEFKKMVPQIKSSIKQVEENLNNVKTKEMVKKVQQAVQQVKQKVNEVKNTGIDKQLQSQFDRAGASVEKYQGQLEQVKEKLRQVYAQMDSIQTNTWKQYTPDGVELGNKAIEPTVNNALNNNKQYQSLSKEASKLEQQIQGLNSKLNTTKQEYSQIAGQIQEASAKQGIWGNAINKVRSIIDNVKKNIKGAKDNFEGMSTVTERVRSGCSQILNVTTKVTSRIKQMGTGFKQGLTHVLKYAVAMLSLESIYGTLSSSANSWLSSQNAQAQQLQANIDYLKYGFGSSLAPVIQYVVNLIYQLMKAIQSVVYALTGINIFANASAKAYSSMADSAKETAKATKQLAGVHDEINNIQSTDSSSGNSGNTSPSFDLSNVEGINSTIIDSIKNGNWYEVGATIGEKLNEAMNNIPWKKIQDGARKIGTGIAEFLNGFIAKTNWNQVGNTFAQGLNTVIYFGYSFVTTFDWKKFGIAISSAINGFFKNVDWKTAGQTLGEGFKGVLDTLKNAISETDWVEVGKSIADFLINIDWYGIFTGLEEVLSNALLGIFQIAWGIFSESANTDIELNWNSMWKSLEQSTDVAMGIQDNLIEAGMKKLLQTMGLNQDQANYVWDNKWKLAGEYLSQNWENFKNTIKEKSQQIGNDISSFVNNAKDIVSNKFTEMKNTAGEIWSNIKNSISSKITEIKNEISRKFQDAYNSIRNTFNNIGSFFSNIWNNVKNSFSNLGTSIGNAISNSVKSGINGVISLIQNTINRAIGLINGAIGLINLLPGVSVGRISTITLPRLATGAVLKVPTVAEMAEYPGASQNPEIVTPQNIMEETFDRVLSRYQDNNSGQPIRIQVYFGAKNVIDEVIDGINEKTRRTGKAQIKVGYT